MRAREEEPALRPWLSSSAPSAPALLWPFHLTHGNAGPRYPALIRPLSLLPSTYPLLPVPTP